MDLPPDAWPLLADELGDVLAWIERIDRVTLVDSTCEPASSSSIDAGSPAHEADDAPNAELSSTADTALRRAPAHRDRFFLVPES
ncbi:MAG: hypothetical protein AAGE94_09115 [Acidobacteriota bacterium]